MVTVSDVPNYINNYFANISKELAANAKGTWETQTEARESSFSFKEIYLQELIKVFNDIDMNKSSAILISRPIF